MNTAYRLHFIARDGAGRVQPDVASVPFTTLRLEQSIDFAQPAAQTFGTTFTPVATATSGLAVTFSASAPEVCTVDAAGVFSFHSAGTCTMTARQGGDATYAPAPEVAYPVTVQPAAQNIVWSMPAPLVVDARVALSAAGGGSSQAVQFSSLTPAACSVSGAEVSSRLAGTDNCLLAADQQGDANHLPAARQVLSLSIGKGPQAIAFTSVAPAAAKVGDTYAVAATGGASGKAVVFSVDAATAAHCTIAGGSVSFIAPGPCRILADQAGDANYEAAARQQQSVQIAQATTTLAITSTPNPSRPGDDVTISVSAVTGAQDRRGRCGRWRRRSSGSITVSYNGAQLGSAPLVGGAASITVRLPVAAGSHGLVVDYSGDAVYAPMSQGFTQAVVAAPVPTPVPALHTVALVMLSLLAAGMGPAGCAGAAWAAWAGRPGCRAA
ncbi:Ig-like domain-containing protein [Delftia tsuruhatensis]